jgi:hypothetical protein
MITVKAAFEKQLEKPITLDKYRISKTESKYFNGDSYQIGDNLLFGFFITNNKNGEMEYSLKSVTERQFPLLEVIEIKGTEDFLIPVLKIK